MRGESQKRSGASVGTIRSTCSAGYSVCGSDSCRSARACERLSCVAIDFLFYFFDVVGVSIWKW